METTRYCENRGAKDGVAHFRNWGVVWGLCEACADLPAVDMKARYDYKTGVCQDCVEMSEDPMHQVDNGQK
jgi:hypothetical protein